MEDAHQNALISCLENCLKLLKSLKKTVISSHSLLVGKLASQQNPDEIPNLENVLKECENYGRKMAEDYEKLENEAKKLPQQTPSSLMVNKLNNFLLDCATNPQMKQAYDNTRSVFDWSESTANYINFAYDLFKIANMTNQMQQRVRKLTIAHQINVFNEIEQIRTEPSSTPHSSFVVMLENLRGRHVINTSHGDFKLYYNFIERSVLNSVIEVKYFAIPKNRTSDGQLVCMQKFLMLVNNGIIEYLHFAAPHEDWHYEDCTGIVGRKQIDLSQQSRFELYQKLTTYANLVVHAVTNTVANFKILSMLLKQLSRLVLINQQCLRCGKRLRDFTPVIEHITNNPVHMSCK
ncbi:hypothetical protein ACQ4LE_006437 [Meloidogyne hapla]|uniref:Mediator of RNA polymerase II transcription subunit 27 n=1 Tax=Meloidogyne hapla TaxID=6305 RepID=A0A1I8BR95_MELHA